MAFGYQTHSIVRIARLRIFLMNLFVSFITHPIFLVGLGGAFGSVMRYGLSTWLGQIASHLQFPIATTAINIVGSLLLGCIAGSVSDRNQSAYLVLGVGFCGGFTTFSTLSLELVEHLQQGKVAVALLESGTNLFLGMGALYAGLWLMHAKG